MADGLVRGELIAVVDGPALVLDVRGREQKYPLATDVPITWAQSNMSKPVMVRVRDGVITEVM